MKEIWKDIFNYEGLYQVSNTGKVKSLERKSFNGHVLITNKERFLKFGNNGNGYLFVNLSKDNTQKRLYVHRLVAFAFIPNPLNKETVNHKDGNKLNNCVENLEWCSQKENNQHARRTGLIKITEETKKKISASKRGKLNPHHKRVICLETGIIFDTIKQASDSLGFHKTAVSNAILNNRKSGGYHFKYYDS